MSDVEEEQPVRKRGRPRGPNYKPRVEKEKPKRGRGRPKKDAKGRGRPKKHKVEVNESENEVDEDVVSVKKAKGRPKKV